MSVSGIESLGAAGFTPYVAPTVAPSAAPAPTGTSAAGGAGSDFGRMVVDGLDRLDATQRTADGMAVQAATGKLENLHDYTIAATQAQVTTQVTVAVRNKAVEAFTEIMRMQVG
ncbi:flagellar hook-basal body complex protein FliE [Nocardioides sp. Leaf374]|uniref:flagellar hook-basal body complex protein FliE n=1 Tax=Nocardioides sp. Leaf374 TaxID=2876560 RepID=UPI001E36506B|nr:flagellar hook-basal body complex protein FliE [Nocardioides sp. Leaf374]